MMMVVQVPTLLSIFVLALAAVVALADDAPASAPSPVASAPGFLSSALLVSTLAALVGFIILG